MTSCARITDNTFCMTTDTAISSKRMRVICADLQPELGSLAKRLS